MGALITRLFTGRSASCAICIVLFCIAAPLWAQTDAQRVDRVEFKGLISYTPARLLPQLRVQAGRIYSPADARADITYLGQIMSHASVSTEPSPEGGLIVTYTVVEPPRFRTLQIVGNKRISTAQIEKLAKFKPGEPLTEKALNSFRKALRDRYRESGMPQAEISAPILIDVPPDPKDKTPAPQADVQVIIDEGRQVQVVDLVLQGNKKFSSVRLRLQLQTKGSWGFLKNYYSEETFQEDLKRLEQFYEDHGYFDVKVDRGPFKEEQRGAVGVVTPVIRITEGERWTLGKITVRGARLFSQADVMAPFAGLEGKPYSRKTFAAAGQQLIELYQDHGLLAAKFDAKYDYSDTANKKLNVSIDISEEERIYVGKVTLVRPVYEEDEQPSRFRQWYNRFSPPVKEETVLREVLLKPGEIYSERLKKDTIRRLAQLGVFEAGNDENGEPLLRIDPKPTGEPGVYDAQISAMESNTGQIGGGVGVGDVTGPFVFASFSDRNVGGQANVLSVQALMGTRDTSLIFSFLDRHIGDTDDSLMYRAYLQNQILPGYRARVIGTTVEYGRPITSSWTVYARPRLEFVSLAPRRNADDDAEEDLDRSYPVLTGRIRGVEDTRWPVEGRPREGYQQSYSAEAGWAGGPLVRLEGMRDQYFPVNATGSVTYRMMAFAGLMPFDRDSVPIHERYFLGGDTDMRGFRYRGAGFFDEGDEDIPIGGATKLLIKNELAYPLYDPISGVVFADVGVLGKSPISWQLPRLSTGVGLRFDMRRVQVALDFAVPVLTQGNDQTRFFHFSLQGEL